MAPDAERETPFLSVLSVSGQENTSFAPAPAPLDIGNDKEHPFYVFLVGQQTAGEIREPVLGEELDEVRTCVAPQASSNPLLAKYGSALDGKVAEADQRVAGLQAEIASLEARLPPAVQL